MNSLVVSALVFAVGCTEQEALDDDAGVAVGDGKTDGVSEFTLTISTSGGALKASESPKLPGAPSSSTKLSCAIDDRTENGWRLICDRGKEQLRLTYDPEAKIGAGIYVKTSASPDRRSYYHCAATTAAANAWPTKLQCTAKTPKTIISGQLVSPFASSLEDVGIFNSHLVSTASNGTKLFRGMKPFRDADFADLEMLGVEAVLIFKKPTGTSEVDEEIDALGPIGVSTTNVANEQFPWKDFTDFKEPCRMTVRSLKLLRDWTAAGKTTFFHCTVGEDRTGYLAGLYRLLTETTTAKAMFEQEMCERGYSSGNPQKPYVAVAREVDADLTPIFLKMAFKIAKGELTKTSLDESVCDVDPAGTAAFAAAEWDATAFRCRPSTRYRL